MRRARRPGAARAGVRHGVRLRRLLRLRRADARPATCGCASTGPCSTRPLDASRIACACAGLGDRLLRHRARPPDRQRLGHVRRDRRPARVRRRAARATSRSPPSSPRPSRSSRAQGNPPPRLWELGGGHDQLDRAAEQGARRLPRRGPAAARRAAGAADRQRDGLSAARRSATLVAAFAERDEVAALELNVSCPNVKTGLLMGADPGETAALLDAVRPRDRQAADRQAHAELRVAGRGRGGGRGSTAPTPSRSINTLRGDGDGPAPAGASRGSAAAPAACRARRCARSRSRRCARCARASRIPIVGMGGVQTGRHARDLLDAGADLVAVGHRDRSATRCAGARIAAELREMVANSGDIRARRRPRVRA